MKANEGSNLLVDPWIEVLTTSGEQETVSLLGLIRRAHQLREITGDLPTQSFAILRLTLAILHRALDGPESTEDWHELWENPTAPTEVIETYLDKYTDRFDLFHPQTPFFQVADLMTKNGEFSGPEKLVADVPAGHPYFTTRIGRGLEFLTYAEAARWLVHLQAFDYSGIKSGAVGDPRVKGGKGYPIGTGWAGAIGGIVVEGKNLWQTLLLNLVPRDLPTFAAHSERDRPAWEAPPSTAAEAADIASRPYGPMDLYTWQARRVRLIGGPGGVTGVLVTNGDKITPQDRHKHEPMSAWRRSVPQQQALKRPLVYMPRRHDPSRALWRGLGQLLPCATPRGKADEGADGLTAGVVEWAAEAMGGRARISVRAIGMEYGTQSATVADVVDDRLSLSTDLLARADPRLPSALIDAVEASEDGVRALRNLASNLVRAAGGDDQLADGARNRAASQAYAELNGPIRQWISTLDGESDPDAARFAWHAQARGILHRIGDQLVTEAGPSAWLGREVRGRRVTSPEASRWFALAIAKHLPREPWNPEEDAA